MTCWEKPADEGDAARMLRRLSDRAHDVLTGIAIAEREQVCTDVAWRVWFLPLSERKSNGTSLAANGRTRLGRYAIQGLASRFIDRGSKGPTTTWSACLWQPSCGSYTLRERGLTG